MSAIPAHFRLALKPTASPDAVVQCGSARFTVLTDRLIRLEYDASSTFEDRASQTFWYREQPVPDFSVKTHDDGVEIETECLHLRYIADGGGFTRENLLIRVKTLSALWHPGDSDPFNLRGTTRTLDMINGSAPLSSGLMSRSGWSLVDDSGTLVFNEAGWVEARPKGTTDWYFFGYGHDYKACLADYCRISGSAPLIPRWILGNWWSRYWHYTQAELEQLMNDFQAHELPLSVCIVDMDWHLTKTNNASSGWTGYTWDRDLFPDPEGFIQFLHDKGLRTALNLHPADGVHNHEAAYPEMARRMGIDPASGDPVPFDITDPQFVNAYFEVLHHPQEAMGVDFWWIDWQQGQKSKIAELDPLWLINHLHFLDLGRDGTRRPFIFSRWGDQGHQRYPIGFSGDSYMSWETLRFEPYLTATASNVAYGWWSHDIGGHTSGTGDAELFTRWVQFGIFSPIMRIHSTKGAFYDQRPWAFENAEVTRVLRETLQFRHALIPYLYTMAWRAHIDSLPLMLPMYYDYPDVEAAYHCPQQYLFGTELIAAPFVDPADPTTGLSRQVVWLPPGDWTNFFTGEYYAGDQWHAVYGLLGDIPLFAKAGAIVPLNPQQGWGGVENSDELYIHVFAGADNRFTLYEDDGATQDYLSAHYCTTEISQRWQESSLSVSIHASQGAVALIPAQRTYHLVIHGVVDGAAHTVSINDSPLTAESTYDAATETLHVSGIALHTGESLTFSLKTAEKSLLSRRNRQRATLLRMLRAYRLNSGIRNRLAEIIDAVLANPRELAPYLLAMSQGQARGLFETLYSAGVHHIADTDAPTRLILWNNREDSSITYRYADTFLQFGMIRSANHHNGVLPRFATLTPKIETWASGAVNEHVHRTQWLLQVDYHNLATVVEEHREQTP
jgi:alpha-glucosidase (family GH31 glycosyl hydrolase)